MSTTFGIVIKNGKILDHFSQEDGLESTPELESEDCNILEIAFQSNRGGILWTNPIAQFLPKHFKVYALDNSPGGIYTIGDILKEIENDKQN